MDNKFLEAYIHLEKLCSEMYDEPHGITKYIEDMEETSASIQGRIPSWNATYKKLKEVRWKRNQFVHEGNVEYNNDDIRWLNSFYKDIMDGVDPLSVRQQLKSKRKAENYQRRVVSIERIYEQPQISRPRKRKRRENTFLVILAVILSICICGLLAYINWWL